jgi:hypothetical protein
MIQSAIYPVELGLSSEHFFIVKLQFRLLANTGRIVTIKQINLRVHDTVFNLQTQKEEPKETIITKNFK